MSMCLMLVQAERCLLGTFIMVLRLFRMRGEVKCWSDLFCDTLEINLAVYMITNLIFTVQLSPFFDLPLNHSPSKLLVITSSRVGLGVLWIV